MQPGAHCGGEQLYDRVRQSIEHYLTTIFDVRARCCSTRIPASYSPAVLDIAHAGNALVGRRPAAQLLLQVLRVVHHLDEASQRALCVLGAFLSLRLATREREYPSALFSSPPIHE